MPGRARRGARRRGLLVATMVGTMVGTMAGAVALVMAGAPSASAQKRPASASLIDLPETPAQLELEPTWQAQTLPALPATSDVIGPARLVAMYREMPAARPRRKDVALSLVVLRFDAPNPRAWRSQTREAYFDEIEAAVVAPCRGKGAQGAKAANGPSCRGFANPKRKTLELEAVPVMELTGKDGSGATRMFRFVFFRTYAIVAAIEVPAKAPAAALTRARRALSGFTVMPNWQR